MALRDPEMPQGTPDALRGPASAISYLNGNGPLVQRLKMDRKQSSPMAPPFMVSAPGKVIVFGEHSVVHGKVSCPRSRPLSGPDCATLGRY